MLGRAAAFETALRLKREFLPIEADVTHAHLGIPTGLALLEMQEQPLVVTAHQSTLDRVFGQVGGIGAYREVVRGADAFLCVSEHLKHQVVAAIGAEFAFMIEVVPNVVDLSDIPFRPRNEGALDHWVYVGTVARHKGVELLMKSFKLHRKKNADAVLTIVGDGPHRAWVERFSSASGIAGSLNFVGSVDHDKIGAYLDAADVMVHLSPSETFGITSLEAIGAGLPVVSLRNGGADSTWGDFESAVGRLLPVNAEPEDVVAGVRSLHDHNSDLDSLRGLAEVVARYSQASVGSRLEQIYSEVA